MEYVGLRWYKCDFHLHTMSSKCYKTQTDTPEMWVEKIKKEGLQCVAITDHNDYQGIDNIKLLCEKEGIVAFPGVELSCDSSKVHLLILFDITCTSNDVREFLNSVGIYKGKYGDSGCTCEGDIKSVCLKAHKMGGLIIAAHIDEYNGISEISFDNMKEILDRKYIDAVQVVNSEIWKEYENNNGWNATCLKLREKYGKTIYENQAKDWHNAFVLANRSKLPLLTFSDNPSAKNESKHGLWGIGSDYTWLKMNHTPDLESIRQAFLSHDMRVKPIYENKQKPDETPELWINSIKIYKTVLNKEEIAVYFNPQLNTIIGGRGSGKSSIIRMLAGGMHSFDAGSLNIIKQEQENFYKESGKDKLGKERNGVFTKDSRIEIFFERALDTYKLVVSDIKNMNNQKRTLYRFIKEEWVEIIDKNYLDFFKAQVYTQKQIYEIAIDSNSLMNIIDEDIDNFHQKLDEKEASLSEVIAKWLEIWNLQKSIEEEEKIKTEINDIDDQINKYNESGISIALNEKQRFTAEKKAVDDYITQKNGQVERINRAVNDIIAEKLDYSRVNNQEIQTLIEKDLNLLKDRKKAVSRILELLVNDTKELIDSINKSDWNKQINEADGKYNEACRLLQGQGVDFNKLDELLEKKKAKLKDLDKINLDKQRLKKAEIEREQLYVQYKNLVKEITMLRSEFIRIVIGEDSNVKFDIQRNRNRSSFVQIMKSVLNRDNVTIEEDINKLSDVFFASNGIEKFRQQMWNIRKEKDKNSCSWRTRTAILEMQPESFARMISFLPEDDLKVSYKPENSSKYIPLSNASAGQKTTAILTFLLSYGDVPLLLDQPEDDLDNKLVYDLIVARLKKTKSKRQVIIVTHNANIPVNADSEYIVSLNSETDEVAVKFEGTMDDENIRKEICDVMEGTKYAFEMRAKKYHFKIIE